MPAPLAAQLRSFVAQPLVRATVAFVQARGIRCLDPLVSLLERAADELDALYDEVARANALLADRQQR